MTIYELAELFDFKIILHYVHNKKSPWYCEFEHVETKDNKEDEILTGTTGDGFTPDEAIKNYVDNIKGKFLVFNAYSKERQEFNVPKNLTDK